MRDPQPLIDGPALRNRRPWAGFSSISAALTACLTFATGSSLAGDILRGGAPAGVRTSSGGSGGVPSAEAARARANAQDALSRTTQAVQAVQKMQAAARAAAQGRNNLGTDPNHPGQPLPNVPNGLRPGGLEVAPGVGTDPKLWQGAELPSGGTSNNVTIKQTAAQAILNWKTFNVGKETTVYFDQRLGGSSSGQWIAFNKISDPSGVPSQILGKIKAEGQVYVINPNGIIFGGTSQVNTHALVASALPINDNLIARGLLNNPAAQFLFSALPLPSSTKGPTPAFTPSAPLTPDGRTGDVVVQKGAVLSSPTTPEKVGGRISLIGANVVNEGTISTPDGQTILAAGLQVGFTAHASSDPSLRGLDTFVGSVTYPSGSSPDLPPVGQVTNLGLIDAPRANVTMIGKTVQQRSVIDSTTSTALNGRVDLLADYGALSNPNYDPLDPSQGLIFLTQKSGTVELGVGSVIRILPELTGTDKAVGSQLALASQVNVRGQAIHFAENSQLLAPNAQVNVSAGNWLATGGLITALTYTGGQVYFDPGAAINVAGSFDISAPISENILTLQLRGSELANSPLQRTGPLRGPTITVDARQTGTYNGLAWVGTPLGDVSGYLGIIQRNVGELTTAGGKVTLNAGEAVIMQRGSTIDVSGGWINYEGAMVQTTRVLSGGVLYDLSKATPDRAYDGIYTGTSTFSHAKYGITRTYSQPLALMGTHYEQSYLQGANAGSITIAAPSMALDGTLLGQAVQGPRQSSTSAIAFATRGSLSLNFQAAETAAPFWLFSPTPPRITFSSLLELPAPATFALAADGTVDPLREERKKEVILSPELLASNGFGTLKIENSDGIIVIPKTTTLAAPWQGSISLRAANLEIAGTVTAPGGSLNFAVFDYSQFSLAKLKIDSNRTLPSPDATRGVFSLGSAATLSTAGLITDYRPGAPDALGVPPLVDGGQVTINAYTAKLASGSVIDVSGGVSINATGRRTYGAGGSIVINAGREPDPALTALLGGELELGATLKGYSGTKGGSLTIQAPLIQIGGPKPKLISSQVQTDPVELVYSINDTEVGANELLYLTPDFFTQGGFSSYTLNALGKAAASGGLDQFLPAISIAPKTVIKPVAESLLAVVGSPADPITLQHFVKPEGLRSPVSLSFGALETKDEISPSAAFGIVLRGDFVLGAGALIQTDPRASVTIKGSTAAILGSIIAPGGNISVTGSDRFPTTNSVGQTRALPTVDLGPASVLSTAGRVLLTPDAYGRRIGSVLAGGNITVSGNIVAEAGALLDVSGTHDILDLAPTSLVQNIPAADSLGLNWLVPGGSGLTAPLFSLHTVPVRVESDAGTIILRGGQELFTDATLRGFAGGPSAKGGSLSISSGRFLQQGTLALTKPLDVNLIVTQSGHTLPTGFYPQDGNAIGQPVPVESGDATLGLGHFAVDSFLRGGFDSLKLSGIGGINGDSKGAVQFSGPVEIIARRSLTVSDGGVIYADSSVYLEAPYVALGTPFITPLQATQTSNLSFAGDTSGAAYFLPTFGSGHLTVRASLIDIGNLSLQNIGRATFIADDGDIRGNGTLNVAGTIELRAGQVYPTTASRFTIAAYDPNVVVATSSTNSSEVTLASSLLPAGFGVGSPLLGSTVLAINGTTVTLASNANTAISANTPVVFAPGTGKVVITGSGTRPLPLSAGGTLSVYASNIEQGGTLRAPLGTINLGWDGTGASPVDYISGAGLVTGKAVPVTQHLTLSRGGVTSVSAINPTNGQGLIIPYGFSPDGTSWIDPTGIDITAGGVPAKTVNVSAVSLTTQSGSLIDVRGGGDLYADRWVTGLNGTRDILASTGSFAVLPNYEANYAPYAPFNSFAADTNLASSDPGYVNAGLAVGDRVYLGASSGLAAGTYTLLPARYALLPGAVLVTPQTGAALGTFLQPEGASIVSGYRLNDLNAQQQSTALATRFEVAPATVFRARAEYHDFLANTSLKESAEALGITIPRLPTDAGHVILAGLNSLKIDGDIAGRSLTGGHGAQIDLSTLADIVITAPGGTGPSGSVVLNAAQLNSFGAESLLIGGTRQTTSAGTTLTIRTGHLTVDNAGTPLTGPEIILAATTNLTLAPGAEIVQTGTTSPGNDGPASKLLIGDASVAGSGNGVLLRVSDVQVPIIRSGTTTLAQQAALANPPTLTIGAGATVTGTALLLDSTYGTQLDPTATITGTDLAFNSGQIILEFDNPGVVPSIPGLTISGAALRGLQSAQSLSLLSYSSIDIYGTGTFSTLGAFALSAGEIRGFNNGGGTVTFSAPEIVLANLSNSASPGAVTAPSGGLVFDAAVVVLGDGRLSVDQFASVSLLTTGGIVAAGTGGLTTQGDLTMTTPLITAAQAVKYDITATGALNVLRSANATATGNAGLGASLSLTGASVSVNTDINLASGTINLRATAGDLLVGNLGPARIEAAGTAQTFNSLTQYTDGGRITFQADTGSVLLGAGSEVVVAAQPGGGDAGSVSISAAQGTFVLNGVLDGRGGADGASGTFSLDVNSLADVTPVDQILNAASFDEAREIRVRSGDVTLNGLATAHTYHLSADQGSITVGGQGIIDASGATGGDIALSAFGGVTLESGARLTVAGQDFNSAGKGGAILLEAGAQHNGTVGAGVLDIQTGSTLDLSVASKVSFDPATDAVTPGTSAYLGRFSGTLHLRAPQNAAGTDLFVNPINGTIVGASSILVEGYRLFDLTNTSGVITNAGTLNAAGGLMTAGNNIQGSINANGQNFLGTAGTTTAGYTAMYNRLLGADAQGLGSIFVLAPGAEIINRAGDLTLGATNSTTTSDWNLSTFRYGEKRAAGVLTIRAAGNLVFYNTLSDGFTPTLASSNAAWMYQAALTTQNLLLPINTQSWSYRLTSGADLGAANFHEVQPLASLGSNSGSLQLGKIVTGANSTNGIPVVTTGATGLTSTALAGRYQVIRTGSGDIDISSGRDVQLLNQFATIYTAGTQVADPTLGGSFQTPPSLSSINTGNQDTLGSVQMTPAYPAQYSVGGGNVTITAQQDIKHQTMSGGVLVADSQKQMPNNWLYRRGYVDPVTGQFGTMAYASAPAGGNEIGSTTWWIDFSNFFEGVGALGGGNVTLVAGRDVSNVDAVAPTNARMTYKTPTGDLLAANQTLVELGGGDVTVRAGQNIDAGIYYVERGRGTLTAGDSIITNSTRTLSVGTTSANTNPSSTQWLPTTLFLGKGGFDVSAAGDVLLGPVVNPFLLPGGLNNSFWRKTYFSTYDPSSEVNVSSLGGTITLRESSTQPGLNDDAPILQNWMQAIHLLTTNPQSLSALQPWLRLNERLVTPFTTGFSLLPGTVRATSFSGDINLVGRFNLSPSPTGTIELAAAGSVNGLQITGYTTAEGGTGDLHPIWGSATINVSDASPTLLPSIYTPYAYRLRSGTVLSAARQTATDFLAFIDAGFAETGSSDGAAAVLQTQQALHGTTLLHANDPDPIRIYSTYGDISGFTLFSSKAAEIVAGRDITDVAFYIQNNRASDVSVVSSGRDIFLYNANSLLRTAAQSPDNLLNTGELPLAGDIQISGPGTLEVLAGRDLDLGTGSNNADGTGVGITSIGQARNPNLPFAGADIVAAAGVGPASGLARSALDFETFVTTVINGPDGARYLSELAAANPNLATGLDIANFDQLDPELQAKLALEIFYLVLRDTGRDYFVAGSPGFGNYDAGYAAIAALFGDSASTGEITTRARDIRTKSGGSISLLAPGGGLTLATSTIGTPLAPPGIITEAGGDISIFTHDNVDIGISRIFTLRGGSEIIWSTAGNIAAGSSSKTVQSAPPTRVLIDPQSADLKLDLAGLATGGGIGVLATVGGVPPGSVDLIAPTGEVDAGDAGIRATGDLNIAAVKILNADNIQVGGSSTGVPSAPQVAAPNLGNLTAASNSVGATSSAANEVANQQRRTEEPMETPSIITVEVLGYGGDESSPEGQ